MSPGWGIITSASYFVASSPQAIVTEEHQGSDLKTPWFLSHRQLPMLHSSGELWRLVSHHKSRFLYLWKQPPDKSIGRGHTLHYQTYIRHSVACPVSALSVTNMPTVGIDWLLFNIRFTKPSHLYIYIYIYIYIYCHPQTDCFVVSKLFSVVRHVGHFKLGSRLSIIPLTQQATYVSSGIIRHYVVAFVCLHLPYRIPECSIH